jgi:hypothetical protein
MYLKKDIFISYNTVKTDKSLTGCSILGSIFDSSMIFLLSSAKLQNAWCLTIVPHAHILRAYAYEHEPHAC